MHKINILMTNARAKTIACDVSVLRKVGISRNQYNSRIVLRKVGILTLLRNSGIVLVQFQNGAKNCFVMSVGLDMHLRKVGLGLDKERISSITA